MAEEGTSSALEWRLLREFAMINAHGSRAVASSLGRGRTLVPEQRGRAPRIVGATFVLLALIGATILALFLCPAILLRLVFRLVPGWPW